MYFRVILCRSTDTSSGSRADVEKQLELMGAIRLGAFSVDSALYVPVNVEGELTAIT